MDRNEQKNNFQNVQNKRKREKKRSGVGGILTIVAVVVLAVCIGVVYWQASTSYQKLRGRVVKLEREVRDLEKLLTPTPEPTAVPELTATPVPTEAPAEGESDEESEGDGTTDEDAGLADGENGETIYDNNDLVDDGNV